jgi:hypothetical protein
MNLWELIKNGAEEGLEVLKEGIWVFMAEAGRTSRMLKKRVELTAVQGQVRKAFTQLGSLSYELHSKGQLDTYGNEEIKALIVQVEGHETRVREIAAEIETIRREERRKTSGRASEAGMQPPMPHL